MKTNRFSQVAQSDSPVSAKAGKVLLALGAAGDGTMSIAGDGKKTGGISEDIVAELLGADLISRRPDGQFVISDAGSAWVARHHAALRAEHIDPFTAQHLDIAAKEIDAPEGRRTVVVDDNESPLGWLARRKGRDGQPLLAAHQVAAGERLRAEFTRAHLMPRVTSNWDAAVSQGGRADNGGRMNMTEAQVAARQRVQHALHAVGPEFSGLLLDVCCFLKGLDDIERERLWPARSAKIVLQLGLNRLARHYGLGAEARGKAKHAVRAWSATPAVHPG